MNNTEIIERVVCLLEGGLFGSFLSAVVLVRWIKKKDIYTLGSKNPGMANVMALFGIKTGLMVLGGDVLKTILAAVAGYWIMGQNPLGILYGGMGAVLGHNWPFWNPKRGGKGVAVTCTLLILFSPLYGTAADIGGMLVVFLTGFLPLGAAVIPFLFFLYCLKMQSLEVMILSLGLFTVMLLRHRHGLLRIVRREEKPILKLIKRKK